MPLPPLPHFFCQEKLDVVLHFDWNVKYWDNFPLKTDTFVLIVVCSVSKTKNTFEYTFCPCRTQFFCWIIIKIESAEPLQSISPSTYGTRFVMKLESQYKYKLESKLIYIHIWVGVQYDGIQYLPFLGRYFSNLNKKWLVFCISIA